MRKQRFKKLWFLVSIVLALILLFSSVYIISEKTVTDDITVEDVKTSAYTTSSVFEEFVKSDGTTYNFETTQNIQTVTEMETADILYGSYQFNHTGAASIVKMVLQELSVTDQWYSKLSKISGYEWIAKFEKDSLYSGDSTLKDSSGNLLVRGNSSAGKLEQINSTDKIYKAYLVVSNQEKNGRRLLKEFPITLIGPNGKYIETKIENIREDTSDRYAGYMDVTEFVKDQGYGWYYCCNVPYLWTGTFSADNYAAWKLVVIEESPTAPLRVLTLKLGLQISSSDPGTSIEINSKDIKTKSEGEVTGQILYSLEGADTAKESNYLRVIVDGVSSSDIYKETGNTKVLRTDTVPMIEMFTRNGKIIENLYKFDSKADSITNYTAYTYKDSDGKTYTLNGKRQGSDTDLIDIDGNKTYTNIAIGNNKSSIIFNFRTEGCVLHSTALGLAMDIEGTDYENSINTEIDLSVSEKEIVVTGDSKNTYGNNDTGLYETKTIINLDSDIIVDPDKVVVTAYWKKNGTTDQIEISSDDILIEDNKITILWGDDLTDVQDLTLYGDTLIFTISGLEVGTLKSKYLNDVSVSGNLYSSGVKTDKVIGEIAKEESYIEYGDITITKEWLDDSNILGLRPNTISVDLYRNDTIGTVTKIGTFKITTDKVANTQDYVINDMLMSDSSGDYTYYIEEHEINLSNGDSYVSEIDGMNITNKLTGTISKTVDVTWIDKKNANDTRPENLNVELYQNGTKIDEYNLTVEEESSHTFTDLVKYDENGKLYEYTAGVTETPVGYDTTTDGLEITNTLLEKNYTVEYYYDGIINDEKTDTISAYYKDLIETYTDKNITGYTLEKEENLPLTIELDEDTNIIRIYYVKDKFKYTVEYYYDGIRNSSNYETYEGTYLDEITDYVDKNITGYKLEKIVNRPLKISEIAENNVMKVYYVKDEFDYTIEYYYDGEIDEENTEFLMATYQDVIKKYPAKNKTGYKLEKIDGLPLTITEVAGNNVIRIYYIKDNFDYTVEYYYDGVINKNKTEVIEATYQDLIENYTDKNITGYTLEKTENLPLTITEVESDNVIKIYYVKDKFDYTVEYYYEGVLDEENTEIIEATYKDVIKTYTDKVKVGYKFDETDNLPLTISEKEENNLIKVYYVIDEKQTKELSYTVEYYKEGVKVDEDTDTEKVTVQILQPDTLSVNKTKINLVNKYAGYKLEKTEPEDIPDVVNIGDVIKVYYIKDNFDYTVKYYYDGIENEDYKEIYNATYEEVIEDYIDKTIKGYILEKEENLPLTITEKEENNVINIYYAKRTDIEYTVEYYYENVLDETKTEVIQNQRYGDIIESYTDKVITGYKYETDTAPIVLDEENNVIKVYYVKDNFDYKIEYYYEGTKDNSKTETINATFEDIITDYPDKNIEGYKLDKTENLPLTVSENPINNIIKIYYVIDDYNKKELNYTVEYYKDGLKVEDDTQVVTTRVQVLEPDIIKVDKTGINTTNKYIGYKLEKTEPETIPKEVNSGDVIKVYYVKDNFDYTVEYYYDGVIDEEKTEVIEATYEDVIEIYKDKNITGYKLDKTENLPLTITEVEEENVIRIYYVRDKFNYMIEYYYEGTKDEGKTEVTEATYKDIITEYPDKNILGYKVEKEENLPLTVSENPINNIIKVYYVIDESQTKELSYTVEYYKDGVLSKEDTQIVKTTVQILEEEKIIVDKTKINTNNKYLGYKLDNTDPETIPDIVNNGDVIKVYYVLDESQVKTLSYTVEYYKDNVKVENDTQTVKEIVQVLEPDILKVDKTQINTSNKYKGYKLDKTDPEIIPEEVTTGTVIKVYYKVRTDIEYTVEYYYENVLDETKTEVIQNQTYGAIIESYTDKVITGYKLETDTAPIILDEENNVIKVYYIKDTFEYRVEYYYDGICDNTKTDTLKATYQDIIKTYTDKNITGYKVEKTENLPLTITENPMNNIIRVYHVKDNFKYTVEYYYDGIRDDTKTDTFEATYLDVISTYTDKNKTGYKLESTDNVPLTIKEVSIDNIIRIYYVKDKFDYKIEYYFDGVKDDSKTEVIKATFEDEISTYTEKNMVGYVLEKVENLPLIVTENVDNNIIKVYYSKDTFEYVVEYYYDGIKDNSKTERTRAMYQDVIETYEDKNITGYKLDKTENLPLTVTELSSKNIIKIYYTKADYSYTVNYYYDDIQDESKTAVLLATYQEVIEEYPDKTEYGYKFSSVEGLPLKITEKPEENIINVYYERRDSAVKIKYVDKLTGREIEDEVLKTGKALDTFDISEDELEIDGYTLIERPASTIGRFEEEEQTFTYYYAVTSNVIIRYLEKDTDIELLPEEEIVGYEGKSYVTSAKNIENYTFVESTENTQGTMGKKTIEIIYYYLQNTSARVNYIDRETGVILDKIVKTGKVGDLFETKAKDFENYILVKEPTEKTVVMTKDEIVLEYYYARISEGVIEKHIDIVTGEILENITYPGNEGDYYKTSSKKFSGYDVVESMLPINASGTMTVTPIEIKYYYIRKTQVKVEYIDVITGENLLNEYEEDSTEIINGHEGDSYKTTEKVFKDYVIVKSKYPKNTSGIMKVETDENGKVNTLIEVKYYYVHKSDGVEEQFIDETTGEIIKTNLIGGNEGDSYTSTPIEISGYDLVEEKLPTNTEGDMTIEKIEIKYYYIRKIKVTVEYIDIITGNKLKEINSSTQTKQDSTEVIEGHEGDSYKTTEKKFDDYVIVENKYPSNTSGTMKAVIKNGAVVTDIKVTYYYVHVSAGVEEQFIDITTSKIMGTNTIKGNEGDSYTSTPKEISGYDLVSEKMPTNTKGLMTINGIVIKYYYIRRAQITVQYIDRATRKKVQNDTIIIGHEGDIYDIEAPELKGYELVDESLNTSGKMTKKEIVVKFWYEQKEIEEDDDTPVKNDNTTNKNNNITDKTPNTGDMLPVYAITVIMMVIIMNITLQVIIVKRNKE